MKLNFSKKGQEDTNVRASLGWLLLGLLTAIAVAIIMRGILKQGGLP